MADQRTKRERFLPHAFARKGLRCRVARVALDGHEVSDVVDDERHLVSLDGGAWHAAELTCVVEVSRETVSEVFAPHEREAPPGQLLLLLHDAPTRLRRRVARADLEERVELTVRLARDELRATAELAPVLVRAAAASAPAPGFASARGARLAMGRAWSLRIDRLRDPDGQFLDTRYHPFSEDERLRPIADTLFHLEVGDSPTLWINSDHERIVDVLDDRGTRGPRARAREVLFDLIAQSVWTQLFVHAALDLGQTGDVVYDWEDSVLRELLAGLFATERTHPARVARLREAIARDELPALLGRLDAVLQRRSKLVEHVGKLIDEAVERS